MSSTSVRCSTHSESIVRSRTSRSTWRPVARHRPRPRARRAARRRARAGARRSPRGRRGPRASSVGRARRRRGPSRRAPPQALDVPVVGVLADEVLLDERVDLLVEERPDGLGQVLVAEDLVALGVDRLALLVDDVVELDDALADVEVEALDPALGALDRLRHEPRLDRDVLLEARAAPSARSTRSDAKRFMRSSSSDR